MPASTRLSIDVDVAVAGEGPTAFVIAVLARVPNLDAAAFEDLSEPGRQYQQMWGDAGPGDNLTFRPGSAASAGTANVAGSTASMAISAVMKVFMVLVGDLTLEVSDRKRIVIER